MKNGLIKSDSIWYWPNEHAVVLYGWKKLKIYRTDWLKYVLFDRTILKFSVQLTVLYTILSLSQGPAPTKLKGITGNKCS